MDALFGVLDVFAALRIAYMVGGSLASSIHGDPRATRDADVVAEIERRHAASITAHLARDFYVDEQMILDATQQCSSFNVIHRTGFKVDVYLLTAFAPPRTSSSKSWSGFAWAVRSRNDSGGT